MGLPVNGPTDVDVRYVREREVNGGMTFRGDGECRLRTASLLNVRKDARATIIVGDGLDGCTSR